MTFACLEYTSGTSSPGQSLRYKNVDQADQSPVIQTIYEILEWDMKSKPETEIVRDMEVMERRILSMYRDGTASAYDRDEYDMSHAEVLYSVFESAVSDYALLDRMIQDNRVLRAVLRVFEKLLKVNRDYDGSLFATISKHKDWWQTLNLSEIETQNVHDLLCCIAKVSCLGPHDIYYLTWVSPSDILKHFVRAAEDISPLYKAIISRSLDDLIACVSMSPKSILESVKVDWNNSSVELCTVLHLAIDWPDGLRYLLSTEAKRFLNDSRSTEEYSPPIVLACQTPNLESATILLEAGCCLELSLRTGRAFWGTSMECIAVVASNLATRRLQLLKLAQEKLLRFFEGETVMFADLAAASICDSLDKANIPFHQSLRVERDYKSIYSCTAIPFEFFSIFWDAGFRQSRSHDKAGLLPAMTYRCHMFCPPYRKGTFDFLDSYHWMRDHDFLDVTPTDPLKLGLNRSSTAYHYIGAMFGAFFDAKTSESPNHFPDAQCVIDELSRVQVEDQCDCWCNAADHGCSPIKLLLKSHLSERHPGIAMDFDVLRHIVFHHKIVDFWPSATGQNVTGYANELLRLLTFEALDMTHTCCTFEAVHKEIVKDMVSTASEKPAAIFSCRAERVRGIRSLAEERESAHLLEDLMSEFTPQLILQGPGPEAFELFIKGYWRQRVCEPLWRQRISQLYDPDPRVLREMEQHQPFKGFEAPSGVERYALPKRVLRLLGDDFQLMRIDDSSNDSILPSKAENLYEIESLCGMKPFCQYCTKNNPGQDFDSSGGDDSDEDTVYSSF
ncbi:hypothetical protein FPOAC2_04375 [Fusarium poae]